MTRKDKLLKDYLAHPLIQDKYKIADRRIPTTVREGVQSSSPIIKAISYIINEVEKYPSKSEKEVEQLIRKLLNESPL
jgi:hypothetical protein